MAEDKKNKQEKSGKPDKDKDKDKKGMREQVQTYVSLVRIMQTDIPGNKKVLAGLTYIKGVSWSISNAMCKILKLDPNRQMTDLSKEELEKIIAKKRTNAKRAGSWTQKMEDKYNQMVGADDVN